jgi:anti-sigma B factor antagonist
MDIEPDDLTADYTIDGDTAVIRIIGEIDIASRDTVTNAARSAVAEGATSLVLDMSEVTFMDSSGIGAVITAQAIAPVVLRKPSDIVQRLFTTTGLTNNFTVEP